MHSINLIMLAFRNCTGDHLNLSQNLLLIFKNYKQGGNEVTNQTHMTKYNETNRIDGKFG